MSLADCSNISGAVRKKVGLIGFFGWGNFGDELFVEVYKQALGPHFDVSVIHDLQKKPYFTRDLDTVIAEYDAFVIGGGDLLIPWSISELYWKAEYLAKPVFIHSVGVPTWGGYKQDVALRLRTFLGHENVRRVSARDAESAAWIAKHLQRPDVQMEPDMVCALNLPPVVKPAKPLLGIVTRQRKNGADDYTQLAGLCEKAAGAGFGIRHIILGNGLTGRNDFAAAQEFAFPGKEVVYSENIWDQCRAIGECTVLASMKFHGSVVATMYGVPSIVLSPTDKSRNFMRRMDRLDLLSQLNDKRLSDHFSPFMAPIPQATRHQLFMGAWSGLETLKAELAAI